MVSLYVNIGNSTKDPMGRDEKLDGKSPEREKNMRDS